MGPALRNSSSGPLDWTFDAAVRQHKPQHSRLGPEWQTCLMIKQARLRPRLGAFLGHRGIDARGQQER